MLVMEISIDPKMINEFMANKLIESSIGVELEKIIVKKLQECQSSYNNPIEPVVGQFIRDMVQQILKDKFYATVEERVRALMTDEIVKKMIDKMVDTYIKKLLNDA